MLLVLDAMWMQALCERLIVAAKNEAENSNVSPENLRSSPIEGARGKGEIIPVLNQHPFYLVISRGPDYATAPQASFMKPPGRKKNWESDTG